MKKALLLSFVLGLQVLLVPSVASAVGFADPNPLATPPSAEDILREALGETPALPGSATDDTLQTVEVTDETPFLDWGAMAIFENSLGIGTFVQGEQQRAQWDMLWSLRANLYLFHRYLMIQARQDLFQPIIDNVDAGTTKDNQFTVGDTTLTFMIPNIYTEPVTGIRFGAWTDFLFPSSLASQHAERYLTWRLGLNVSRQFGPVGLLYQFRFTKSFTSGKSPVLDYQYLPELARYPAEGVNTDFNFLNRLNLNVKFLEDFYVSLDFFIINSFKYDTAGDITCTDVGLAAGCDLHSPNAKPGRGRSDYMSMGLEVGWQPLRYLAVALGVTTYQPARTSDNESFRFPLNFTDASANYTTIYLDLIGTY